MKKGKATLISLLVVFALVASMSAVSAYSITGGTVTYNGTTDETTWTFDVTCDGDDKWAISHFTVAWCSETDVKEVWVDNDNLTDKYNQDSGWFYGDFDGVHGIKIEYQVNESTTVYVTIILAGDYGDPINNVAYAIKYDNEPVQQGDDLTGPLASACNEIPEFTTVTIPVCMIFGLYYFFRRKRQNE